MKENIQLLEELSLNAWPSYKMEIYDGWLIRYSHFYTHRTNAVEQIGISHIPLLNKIAYCESIYKQYNTPAIFKISPLIDPSFDKLLEKKHYSKQHITYTMTSMLNKNYQFHPKVKIHKQLDSEYIHAILRLNETNHHGIYPIVESMYHSISKEVLLLKIEENGKIVATTMGIIDRDYIGVYCVYVDKQYRDKHYASYLVESLLSIAKNRNIHHTYLQCVEGNHIAFHLYQKLGYEILYKYWFRVKKFKEKNE